MGYLPLTPFGRPAKTAPKALKPDTTATCAPVDKWQILRDLTEARKRFDLSDRDMTVLQALLSFHPAKILETDTAQIVYPSNDAICQRAHGMACSTMRRHLANLVDAGFLIRRDSPNGKRYARQMAGQKIAFGFDLSPLLHRYTEIQDALETTRLEAARRHHLRETASLKRRDLLGLLHFTICEDIANAIRQELMCLAELAGRQLRRKLSLPDLESLNRLLTGGLDRLQAVLMPETEEMSTTDARNEQHIQNSEKEYLDSESGKETKMDDEVVTRPATTRLPLSLVTSTCTEIGLFAEDRITNWNMLEKTAEAVRPMIGISEQVWVDAKRAMGITQAAVTLSAILERFGEIRSPAAYLRHLTKEARNGSFSVARMIFALQGRKAAFPSQL